MSGPIPLRRSLTRGLRVLFRRDRADADLDAELQHFLAEASATASPGELLRIREQVRDAGWEESLHLVLRDVAYARCGASAPTARSPRSSSSPSRSALAKIGVRAALWASRPDILAFVLGQGLTLTMIGVACGAFGAAVAARAVSTLLFGISPLDALTYAVVVTLLGAVSVCACCAPAWRASTRRRCCARTS